MLERFRTRTTQPAPHAEKGKIFLNLNLVEQSAVAQLVEC